MSRWYGVMAGDPVVLANNEAKLKGANFTTRIIGIRLQVYGDKRTMGQAQAKLAGIPYTWDNSRVGR